jgi:hypothetical protein
MMRPRIICTYASKTKTVIHQILTIKKTYTILDVQLGVWNRYQNSHKVKQTKTVQWLDEQNS